MCNAGDPLTFRRSFTICHSNHPRSHVQHRSLIPKRNPAAIRRQLYRQDAIDFFVVSFFVVVSEPFQPGDPDPISALKRIGRVATGLLIAISHFALSSSNGYPENTDRNLPRQPSSPAPVRRSKFCRQSSPNVAVLLASIGSLSPIGPQSVIEPRTSHIRRGPVRRGTPAPPKPPTERSPLSSRPSHTHPQS